MKILLLALAIFSMTALPSMAAFDTYIRFAQSGTSWLDGDSKNEQYNGGEGWSALQSFSFGIENTVNIGSVTGGGGAGKATFKTVNLYKKTDSLSAELFSACALGRHFERVEIVVVRSGETTTGTSRVLRADLRFVMVQDVNLSASDGDEVVSEGVILQHGAHEISFYGQGKAGEELTPKTSTWSRVSNTPTLDL